MATHGPLIATIVAGLVIAFIMGSIAHKLKVSPIAGYLLAGIVVGPFNPGFVADGNLAAELAEIGVILLMFGVGLHFSLRDLLAVKGVAVPGAIGQIAVATLMGMGLSWGMGWDPLAGFVFGLALSVASTVVLLRALQGFGIVDTERGRIAVGWLIVEDLVMVLALVLLPALAEVMKGDAPASWTALLVPLAQTAFKVTGFLVVMLLVARNGLATVPYYSLARGFLSGKYRPGVEVRSPRAAAASKHLDEHGLQVLEVLDELAETRDTTVASVALAWLAQQPTVAAPIASARTLEQLSDLVPLLNLELTQAEVDRLSAI